MVEFYFVGVTWIPGSLCEEFNDGCFDSGMTYLKFNKCLHGHGEVNCHAPSTPTDPKNGTEPFFSISIVNSMLGLK